MGKEELAQEYAFLQHSDSTVIKSIAIEMEQAAAPLRAVNTGGVIKAPFIKEHEAEIGSRIFEKRAAASKAAAQPQSNQAPAQPEEAQPPNSRAAKEITERAKQEAARILEDAEQMAQLTIEDAAARAHAQVEAIYEDARNEGWAAGYREATESVKKESVQQLGELGKIVDSIKGKQVKMLSRYENDLAELAVEIARRIIKREVSTDKKILADMVREVVEDNRRENWVRVTVSEQTEPLEITVDDEVLELITELGPNVTAAISRDVKEGLCLVETPGGSINVALDTQLKNLRKAIRETHTHRS